MTAVEIATGIIDKLQEENRICLDTLHKAQDTIRHSERQLAEKDRLIKVLEERLRMGTDGILEVSNRQKELTIKNLELQIQKLLKENEYLELKLEAVKAELCAKCETRLLLKENSENKSISKSYKSTLGKTSVSSLEKKPSQSLCPNRIKTLERIIEHKDKRITHLSKEVQRLTKTEKDLTQKIYRLTKLLPLSRLPSETLTDCLLKEIQILESQKQSQDKLQLCDDLCKLKMNRPIMKDSISTSKVNISDSNDRFRKTTTSNIKRSTMSLPESEPNDFTDLPKAENEVLFKKLQKLCSDVNELKRLFAFESEKLSRGLHSTTTEYNTFKDHLEEIINNLNEVIQSILSNDNFECKKIFGSTSVESDDKFIIAHLQERLKELLNKISEYENENKMLHEDLKQLRKQLAQQDYHFNRKSEDRMTAVSSTQVQNINDVKKLKEIIKVKEIQLEAAESHLNTCQKFIEELQKTLKQTTFETSKIQCISGVACDEKMPNFCEQQNKSLQTKLNVAEKNIKTCESVIEQLQNSVRHLEEENVRIESELHSVKSQKVLEVSDQKKKTFQSKLNSGETEISNFRKLNQELLDKNKILEEINSRLKVDLKACEEKNTLLEASEEKSLLKAKLDASEKHICSLEKSVETLQNKLETAEDQKKKFETKFKDTTLKKNLAQAYENDVMALKNELILKEEENRDLKESLHTLESKALEMNHYRKSFHQEIENLCKVLIENEDTEDSSRRKAIYKAAVLRSAQALLKLDDNYNLQPEDSDRNSALEEMKHQIEVYLTEVSRIHELITIKEQERDEMLKEYLGVNDIATLKPSLSRHHKSYFQSELPETNLQSSQNVNLLNPVESENLPSNSKETKSTETSTDKLHSVESSIALKVLQEELVATKSVTTYLLSSCTRLEDSLAKERMERAKCERELEVQKEIVKDLKSQLSIKSNVTKRLNSLIEMMRSKECNDEITLEQLKSEIKWLVDENQKIFERVTSTQAELCQCKEENSRIQNDLDSLKRQLLSEKYEHAKVNNELKHLRMQISNSQLVLNDSN